MNVLKVSSKSRVNLVAGSISKSLRESESCQVKAIGAGAVNQAIKAIAVAKQYLVEDKINIYCVPEFTSVSIENQNETAIIINVYKGELVCKII